MDIFSIIGMVLGFALFSFVVYAREKITHFFGKRRCDREIAELHKKYTEDEAREKRAYKRKLKRAHEQYIKGKYLL